MSAARPGRALLAAVVAGTIVGAGIQGTGPPGALAILLAVALLVGAAQQTIP